MGFLLHSDISISGVQSSGDTRGYAQINKTNGESSGAPDTNALGPRDDARMRSLERLQEASTTAGERKNVGKHHRSSRATRIEKNGSLERVKTISTTKTEDKDHYTRERHLRTATSFTPMIRRQHCPSSRSVSFCQPRATQYRGRSFAPSKPKSPHAHAKTPLSGDALSRKRRAITTCPTRHRVPSGDKPPPARYCTDTDRSRQAESAGVLTPRRKTGRARGHGTGSKARRVRHRWEDCITARRAPPGIRGTVDDARAFLRWRVSRPVPLLLYSGRLRTAYTGHTPLCPPHVPPSELKSSISHRLSLRPRALRARC